MTIRILAVIAEAQTVATCLDLAVAAASRIGDATIEPLHVMVDPRRLDTAAEEVDFQLMREVEEGSAQDRAEAVRAAFDAWMARNPAAAPSVVWRKCVGSEERRVSQEARDFDLLVLARPHDLDAHDALHAAFFECDKPLLLAPGDWTPPASGTFARRIAIAWNGSDPCRRAVTGALPLLRRADVTVILVDGSKREEAELIERLADEAITAEIHHFARDDEELGEQLVTQAHRLSADLLVMGAYRHNQLIEWLAGGTTRHAIASADVPLLLSH